MAPPSRPLRAGAGGGSAWRRLAKLSQHVAHRNPQVAARSGVQAACAAAPALLAGCATVAGTAGFVRTRPTGLPPSALGGSGLQISRVGFGCHRLEDTAEQCDALEVAIKCGCNFIDVAPNYSDGAAERAVGGVLQRLVGSGQVRREELVVCTKVGNVVGSSLGLVASGSFGAVAKVRGDAWHCLEPAWIEQEVSRSLARLRLECVDVLLLHCPEFASRAPGVDMQEVYRRIAGAFTHLELEVQRGRVARYGITAAFYPLRPSDPEHLLLPHLLELLPERHHFEVVQFPLNFAEPQALLQAHTARSATGAAVDRERGLAAPTLIELARQHGLATLANRPLDGLYGELRGVLRFTSQAPLHSEMQGEDLDELEAKLTALCEPGLGDPEAPVTEELAAKAVKVLASLGAVDCVLVGMHRVEYVAGIMRLLGQTPPIAATAALDALKAAHNSISMWFCMAAAEEADHGTAKDWRLPAPETEPLPRGGR